MRKVKLGLHARPKGGEGLALALCLLKLLQSSVVMHIQYLKGMMVILI